MKKDKRGINIASKRTGDGCVECLASPKKVAGSASRIALRAATLNPDPTLGRSKGASRLRLRQLAQTSLAFGPDF
jgi:hypothetical protein